MSIELKDVAALISYNRPKAHIALKSCGPSDGTLYELLPPKYRPQEIVVYPMAPLEYERPTPENMFIDNPPKDIYQAFWSIQSSNGCDYNTFLLSSVLVELNKNGYTIQHNGIKVENIVAVNSMSFDISGLQEPKITVPSYLLDNKSSEVIGLYATYDNTIRIKTTQQRCNAYALIGRYVNSFEVSDGDKQVASNDDATMPHWWLCVLLENKRAVHIDLNAIAYDGIFS
jgi:hypothetical protein